MMPSIAGCRPDHGAGFQWNCLPVPGQSLSSYFDPLVEFLELGVATTNQTIWKLMGPDLDGTTVVKMEPAALTAYRRT